MLHITILDFHIPANLSWCENFSLRTTHTDKLILDNRSQAIFNRLSLRPTIKVFQLLYLMLDIDQVNSVVETSYRCRLYNVVAAEIILDDSITVATYCITTDVQTII